MKQIKKILCGTLLTSFIILCSVNVFAVPPAESGGGGNNGSNVSDFQCSQTQTVGTITENQTVICSKTLVHCTRVCCLNRILALAVVNRKNTKIPAVMSVENDEYNFL